MDASQKVDDVTKGITNAHKAISKDMTIGDFVEQYPQLVEILLDEGVHCVGCGAAFWETLEEGLGGHGKTEEEINDVIKRLNDAASDTKTDEFNITHKAAEKLKELLKSKNKEGMALRIKVVSGGCAGHKYSLELDKESQANDTVFDVDGSQFFVDKESLEQLKGATVDYLETLEDSGFKIHNPNAKTNCGCGKSFG
ncbi:MAG: iron-sulfur cluster assembly accessory protein [Nanoarchaeota archaeon]